MTFKAVHMIAHGRVQGVGFRFYVRERAFPHGTKGWVKNLPDGTVEIHAEGEEEQLKGFMNNVKEGTYFGSVSELDVEWVEPENTYTSFNIEF